MEHAFQKNQKVSVFSTKKNLTHYSKVEFFRQNIYIFQKLKLEAIQQSIFS